MMASQRHRGPDGHGSYVDRSGLAQLGHVRLSILDLSDAGRQPMASPDGRWWLAFEGEIYNFLELRSALPDYPFRTRTDTEVLLAAWITWGEAALDRLVGMFAFMIWDSLEQKLTAVRDRFGVKPLVYHVPEAGRLAMASEIPGLEAAGCRLAPDESAWAKYLLQGSQNGTARTFWQDVQRVPPGHLLDWSPGGPPHTREWYDLRAVVGDTIDTRDEEAVTIDYRMLLAEAVRYRFSSDVPVGVAVSGGVDSSALLASISGLAGDGVPTSDHIAAYTFVTGDPAYDERPWVEALHAAYPTSSSVVPLTPREVPSLARDVSGTHTWALRRVATLGQRHSFQRCAGRRLLGAT